MRSRTKVIAAALVTAALAAGGAGAAMASTAGTKPGAPAATVSAGVKRPGSSGPSGQPAGAKAASAKAASAKAVAQPGPGAFIAAVAGELHVGTARAESALRPLLAAGRTDSSSREFAAAASSLSVTPQQLFAALAQAKQSLTGGK
ncbi:MAG TPA: hypothetical protein VFE59_01410 [Trebonia sp.]|nr:hypothetical protein [Trebonia sp.]